MLDTSRYSSYWTKISGTISVVQRGKFAHKTYYFSSLITGQTFNKILKLLDQINIAINKILQRDPHIQEGLWEGRSHKVSFHFKEQTIDPSIQKGYPEPHLNNPLEVTEHIPNNIDKNQLYYNEENRHFFYRGILAGFFIQEGTDCYYNRPFLDKKICAGPELPTVKFLELITRLKLQKPKSLTD